MRCVSVCVTEIYSIDDDSFTSNYALFSLPIRFIFPIDSIDTYRPLSLCYFFKGISSALLESFSLSNDMMSEDIVKIDKIDKDASLCTYSSWLLFFRFKVYVNDKNVAFTRGIVTFYLFIR